MIETFPLNISIFNALHGLAFRSPFFDSVVVFCATVLGTIVVLATIIFLFYHHKSGAEKYSIAWFREKTLAIGSVCGSALAAYVLTIILKHIVSAPRPFALIRDVVPLIPESGFAFPSGHAAFFGAIALIVYKFDKKFGIAFIIAALLIGIARVVAGVHFPIDIVAGYILAAVVAHFADKHITRKLLSL